MKISLNRFNQAGIISLHVLLPGVLAIAAIAGVGAYVISKSGASSVSGVSGVVYPVSAVSAPTTNTSCGKLYRSGAVYYSAVGTNAKFTTAKDSDSIRNIAYKLCGKGLLAPATARSINASGNYSAVLKTSYSSWQKRLGYSGAAADGVPGKVSLQRIGLSPIGF